MLTCLLSVLFSLFLHLFHDVVPLLLYIKLQPGSFQLFLFVLLFITLPGRAMIKTLAFSLVCYLGPALLLSQYSRNQIVEAVNNYTFLLFSGSQFVGDAKNDTSLFSSGIDVFCLVAIALQFLESPWVTRMFLFLYTMNLVLLFPKVNQPLGNVSQGCALRQPICGWQGVWENLGRCLESLLPLTV